MLRRTRALTIVGIAAVAATAASILPILAGDVGGLRLRPVADTTLTRVHQDGDTFAKTTLASCPRLCDGNPDARRDAVLEFAVTDLPADAVQVVAKLRIFAWHDFPARIVTWTVPGGLGGMTVPGSDIDGKGRATQVADEVVRGYNEFDVSAGLRGNGRYTIAVRQESYHSRIYWGSTENSRPDVHPELVVSYRTAARPTSAPARPDPPATAPTTHLPRPTTAAPATTAQRPTTRPAPTTAPATGQTSANGWRPVFSDEFDSAVDRRKWNVRNAEGRDIDSGCNTDSPKNVFVADGKLVLRALRETSRCSSQTRAYSQAYLDTIGKASWTYGRFEMRAKSPNGPGNSTGLWPAFWLRPDDGGNGEIDVVELPGGQRWYAKATQSIFWDYSPVKQDTRTWPVTGGHPGDGFHTYTTEWEPDELRWYIDGKLVWQRDRNSTPWFEAAFGRPYNIRLNFQVGGWLGEPDAATAFPADFMVDYVRVWQR